MKVAYITSRYPSLSHTFVLREVQALRARGIEVQAATVRRPPEEELIGAAEQEEARRTFAILPVRPAALLRVHARALLRGPAAYVRTLLEALADAPLGLRSSAWQLFYFAEAMLVWRWLEDEGLEHVHTHHANVSADLAMIATRFANRTGSTMTWSFTIHGPTEFADVREHKLAVKMRRADAVAAISDFARAEMLALDPAAGQARVSVIRCGVDPDVYAVKREAPRADAPVRVVSVGRLDARKGHAILIEALGLLQAGDPEIQLRLIGDGPERGRLENRVRELGIEDQVSFTGALASDQVAAEYAAADIFCLSSFKEGVPIVLMEAMASGLPVVSTWIAGVAELVDHGDSGLLVPPGRPDKLAEALSTLALDPGRREAYGEAGRDRVRRSYAIDESAARLERLFAGVRAGGPDQRRE